MYVTKNIDQLPTSSDRNINTIAEQHMHDPNPGRDKTRRSTRSEKETKRYGDTTNLDFLDSSDEDEPPQRHAASVASYSPPKTTIGDTPTSPDNNTTPVTPTSRNNIATGPVLQSQDEINMVYTSDEADFNTANYDVRTNQQFAHNTKSQAHLPFILPSTQQPHFITPENSAQQMDNPTNEKTNTTTGSPSPKKALSMTNYLSPHPKQPTIGTTPENEEQLPKPPDDIFNTKLIAAMTNRDTVLREVRDCILTGDEQRCTKLSKQIHAKWRSLSVQNGCILLDNKLAIPNSLKESVIDVLHSTHPGAWGMTELGQRIWWPFINRDLINKSKTCRPCTEFVKNLKSINPKSHWAPLPQCSEPNEEIQLDFEGPTIDGKGREVYFLACRLLLKVPNFETSQKCKRSKHRKVPKQIHRPTRCTTEH